MSIEFIKPDGVFNPGGYTPAVTVKDSTLVAISGQVAWDSDGNVVGKGDLEAQLVQVYENLKTVLASVGADFSHVVKMSIFVVDLQSDQMQLIREVRNRYINLEKPPASTLLGVQALAAPELMVEVEAYAVVPS